MTNEIIVALISLGGSAIGSIIGIISNSRLTNYRLQQLEEREINTIILLKELTNLKKVQNFKMKK